MDKEMRFPELKEQDKFLERTTGLIRNEGPRRTRRVMVGVPLLGVVRSEWMLARYSQVIPCNWSQLDALQWLDQYSPMDFMVADARNVIVHNLLLQEFEWLFQIDSDVVLQYDTFVRMNEYIRKAEVPMLSGIYFTKSKPSEPLIYRGRGMSFYDDWKFGDKVWVDGIPSGLTLIHCSIFRELAKISEDYEVQHGMVVKKIYETPAKIWFDPEQRRWYTATGTEDLTLCDRIMENKIFEKAGWPDFEGKEYPFLCDTSIFGRHIDLDGVVYPSAGEEQEFLEDEDRI